MCDTDSYSTKIMETFKNILWTIRPIRSSKFWSHILLFTIGVNFKVEVSDTVYGMVCQINWYTKSIIFSASYCVYRALVREVIISSYIVLHLIHAWPEYNGYHLLKNWYWSKWLVLYSGVMEEDLNLWPLWPLVLYRVNKKKTIHKVFLSILVTNYIIFKSN